MQAGMMTMYGETTIFPNYLRAQMTSSIINDIDQLLVAMTWW